MVKKAFEKVQGTGNHFVLFPNPWEPLFTAEVIQKICDPAFGIGADGVLFVNESEKATAFMRMFNPDGSPAEMCGNGIRCFAQHLDRAGRLTSDNVDIESLRGIHRCGLIRDDQGQVDKVEVEMGSPSFGDDVPGTVTPPTGLWGFELEREEDGVPLKGYAVSMGNPHLVMFGKTSVEAILRHGPELEHHPAFAQRTNVEMVDVDDEGSVIVNVWERGAGRTLACGTGACAATAAAVKRGKAKPDKSLTVRLPGGDLSIRVAADFSSIRMTGAARLVFTGEIDIPEVN